MLPWRITVLQLCHGSCACTLALPGALAMPVAADTCTSLYRNSPVRLVSVRHHRHRNTPATLSTYASHWPSLTSTMVPRIGVLGRPTHLGAVGSPHLCPTLRSRWTYAGLPARPGIQVSPVQLRMTTPLAVTSRGPSSHMANLRLYVTASAHSMSAQTATTSNAEKRSSSGERVPQAQHPKSAAGVVQVNGATASPGAGDPGEIDAILCSLHRHLRSPDAEAGSRTIPEDAPATITSLYEQMRNRAGTVLDEELPYEATPSPERRVRTQAGVSGSANTGAEHYSETVRLSWRDSCRLAGHRAALPGYNASHLPGLPTSAEGATAEDGLVLVAHVVDSEPPSTSWSLGFVIETTSRTRHVVSCSHTLEAVGVQAALTSCAYEADDSQHSGSSHATIASGTRHKSPSLVIDADSQPVWPGVSCLEHRIRSPPERYPSIQPRRSKWISGWCQEPAFCSGLALSAADLDAAVALHHSSGNRCHRAKTR